MNIDVILKDTIAKSDDIQLAELELSIIGQKIRDKNATTKEYTTTLQIDQLVDRVLQLAFVKEVKIKEIDEAVALKISNKRPHAVSFKEGILRIVPRSLFFDYSAVATAKSRTIQHLEESLNEIIRYVDADFTPSEETDIVLAIRKNGKHNDYFSHGIHKFKAKFFPRMARSMANYCTAFDRSKKIIDPFNGSGTTTLECALLGYDGAGTDIDPVSLKIADVKTKCLALEWASLEKDLSRFERVGIDHKQKKLEIVESPLVFPHEIDRKLTVIQRNELLEDIGSVMKFLGNVKPENKQFFTIILSDAINTKLKMRFMGTGVGRFALSFATTRISSLFIKRAQRMIYNIYAYQYLKDKLKLDELGKTKIYEGDARKISYKDYDVVVTSPPYLPAASGRESYALSKSMSIKLLGDISQNDPNVIDRKIVGSMQSTPRANKPELPDEIYTLVSWLENDTLRNIKAKPTLSYFEDMQEIIRKMAVEMKPNAKVAMVISKSSQFYKYSTRETLFTVDVRGIFETMFTKAGFKKDMILDIELAKSNPFARPRALDKYYETILIFKK